jgi:putative DNA primase/helicase
VEQQQTTQQQQKRQEQEDADAPAAEKQRPLVFQLTDDGNGLRLIHRHGQDLRYCYAWKQWLDWDGRRWKRDDGDGIEMRAKETARALLREAADCTDTNEQKTLATHALKMQSLARLQAMITYARSEVPARPEEWDTDRWLLNCPNGTVDLRTGQKRDHDRADRNTKITAVDFDPDARAPVWEAFLSSILPATDVRTFVQRAIGYALTGDVSEQVLSSSTGQAATESQRCCGSSWTRWAITPCRPPRTC